MGQDQVSLSRFDDRYDFSLGIRNDLSSEPLLVVAQADETIFLVRRSHPETNHCSIRP